jgi:pentatricopeptide repeat protein
MQNEGFSPNMVTFIGVAEACGSIGAIGKGIQIHNEIVNKAMMGRKDTVLGTALVDMYAKCGELGRAEQVFDELLVRDVPTWNAMIRGYAEQGHGEQALKRFSQMLEDEDQPHLSPDVVTFLCVLTACCRSSLVHEGERCFESMSNVYGITPQVEHYTCMVELFGRAGCFDKALDVIEKMPVRDDYPLWLSLLTSCELWGNVSVGRLSFDEAIRIDRSNGSAYACMIRLYVNACMYDEARLIKVMESRKDSAYKTHPQSKIKERSCFVNKRS